jgi:hypothetical protein
MPLSGRFPRLSLGLCVRFEPAHGCCSLAAAARALSGGIVVSGRDCAMNAAMNPTSATNTIGLHGPSSSGIRHASNAEKSRAALTAFGFHSQAKPSPGRQNLSQLFGIRYRFFGRKQRIESPRADRPSPGDERSVGLA